MPLAMYATGTNLYRPGVATSLLSHPNQKLASTTSAAAAPTSAAAATAAAAAAATAAAAAATADAAIAATGLPESGFPGDDNVATALANGKSSTFAFRFYT